MSSDAAGAFIRKRLGSRLLRLREEAGKSLADVSEAGLGSQSKISRLERGLLPIKVADVRALCWLYGANQQTTDELASLAPGTQQQGWWEAYDDLVVPDWLGVYVDTEAAASEIRAYHPELVPGLLQTQAYARAVIASDTALPGEVVEQRVRFRMDRQRSVLEREPAPQVTVILGASALARTLGQPSLIEDQVGYLRRLSGDGGDGVTKVRVLPWDAVYPTRGAYTLLDFAGPEEPPVACVDVPMGTLYLEKPDQLERFRNIWNVMEAASIPIEEYRRQ